MTHVFIFAQRKPWSRPPGDAYKEAGSVSSEAILAGQEWLLVRQAAQRQELFPAQVQFLSRGCYDLHIWRHAQYFAHQAGTR